MTVRSLFLITVWTLFVATLTSFLVINSRLDSSTLELKDETGQIRITMYAMKQGAGITLFSDDGSRIVLSAGHQSRISILSRDDIPSVYLTTNENGDSFIGFGSEQSRLTFQRGDLYEVPEWPESTPIQIGADSSMNPILRGLQLKD